jgi:hypothetical protein
MSALRLPVRMTMRVLRGVKRRLARSRTAVASLRDNAISLSDNDVYPSLCLRAALDHEVFDRFRRDPVYNHILEHVPFGLGQEYLNEVVKDEDVARALGEFRQNDIWGGPVTFDYPGVGQISPTTLRYTKVLADLKRHFGSLSGMRIVEIGIGYGGQCRIIDSFYRPSEYVLVDLKPVLMLAQRFLDKYNLVAQIQYRTMNELGCESADLLLSNYAFSELPRTIQDTYLRKVILRAKRGYVTYNDINPVAFNSYKKEELLAMLPGARFVDEFPLSHERNCILVWGGG